MSKLFAASIAAAVLAIASPLTAQTAPKFPTDSYMAKIISRGTLNVGTKFELLGVGFQNPMTGKVEGFAVDLAADLAERMFGASGKATYRPTLPVNRITMLQQGLIDLDIETMFITKERWGQVDFSEPYWSAPTVIFVHKSNKTVTKLTDLVGKTVASTKGSSSERAFHDPNSGYPKAELVMFDSIAQSIEAIRVGRVELAVFDEVFALAAMKATPDFKIVGEPAAFDYYGIAIAKGHPEFVEYINQWLREIKTNGKWQAIYKKNLPGEVPEPPMPPFSKAFYK